jgi:hypothetical protein
MKKIKKGFYTLFTSFIFIIVALLFLFGLLFYQNLVVEFQGAYHNSVSDLQVLSDSKDKIISCYGNPINFDLVTLTPCENLLINSFELIRFEDEDCTYSNIIKTIKNQSSSKSIVYYVPIKRSRFSSGSCLGTLTLYT